MGRYNKMDEVNILSNPQGEQVEMPAAIARSKPSKLDDPIEPIKPDKPVEPNKPIESVELEKPVEPVKSEVILENKILIGTTCYRTILVRTAWALMDTLREYPETEMAFMNGVFVHENANRLVEIAKEKKASHIFFVEHDMVFEPDTLRRLLKVDKDVVAAAYSGRCLPRQPLVYQMGNNGELYMMSYDVWPKEPFKAYGVPTGCTLVKMSVFDKIKKPYFFFDYSKEGKMQDSQDIYFSKQVNKAGMECWVDPTINIVHIGDFDY